MARELASYLRIEERELEAGGVNQRTRGNPTQTGRPPWICLAIRHALRSRPS